MGGKSSAKHTFPEFDMDPQQVQAFHQSIKRTGHWEKSCVVEALGPAKDILDQKHKYPTQDAIFTYPVDQLKVDR